MKIPKFKEEYTFLLIFALGVLFSSVGIVLLLISLI